MKIQAIVIALCIVLTFFMVLYLLSYIPGKENTVTIILGKRVKVLYKKAGIKIPLFEKSTEISLEPIMVDIKSCGLKSKDLCEFNMNSIIYIKLLNENESIKKLIEKIKKIGYYGVLSSINEIFSILIKANIKKLDFSKIENIENFIKDNANYILNEYGFEYIDFEILYKEKIRNIKYQKDKLVHEKNVVDYSKNCYNSGIKLSN